MDPRAEMLATESGFEALSGSGNDGTTRQLVSEQNERRGSQDNRPTLRSESRCVWSTETLLPTGSLASMRISTAWEEGDPCVRAVPLVQEVEMK